jgi:uncharacterized protein
MASTLIASPPWLSAGRDTVTIRVLAKPESSRRGIIRADPRGLVIALNAWPEKGRANDELIGLISGAIGVPRAALELSSGAGSRHKILRISTTDPASVVSQLIALAASTAP